MVGNALGKLEEVDLEAREMEWGEFMCVRIRMDISKPLVQNKRQTIGTIESFWLTISYKRLLIFCFGCGVIGHSHKECSLWKEKGLEAKFTYGLWLKAGSQNLRHTTNQG